MEEKKQLLAACFTGHRPKKLPAGYDKRLCESLLYEEIRMAIADGARVFYSGMAQGIDLLAAEMVLALRRVHGIRLIAVRPFLAQGKNLRGSELYRYQSILRSANDVVTISERYHPSCFRQRNAYMIDHSQRLIAVVSDMKSGTGQTIRMAREKGLDVRIQYLDSPYLK